MHTLLLPALLLAASSQGWTTTGQEPQPTAGVVASSQRLLLTPTAIIRFGLGTHGLDEIMAGLGASTDPHVVSADLSGILEYACSPRSIIAWGAPLFRIYEPGLLSDIRDAEAAAARIGDRPFVVGPRPFRPGRVEGPIAFPPPLMPRPGEPAPLPPPSTAPPPSHQVAGPVPVRQSLPRAKATLRPTSPAAPTADSPRAASAARRVTAIEERLRGLSLLVEAAAGDVAKAEAAAEPLREDVDARRRLLESGVIARNAVKAAEEQLNAALAQVEAAKARLGEAEAALHEAQTERDAALADLQAAKTPSPAPTAPAPEPVEIVRAPSQAPARTPVPAPAPQDRAPTPVPVVTEGDDFPAPVLGDPTGGAASPPLPGGVELRRPRDVPGALPAPLPLPDADGDLARARWHDQPAEWQCVVTEQLALDGGRVQKGDPVLKLRETTVARLYAEVDEAHVPLCRVGAPVEVAFPSDGAVFRGWVIAAEPTRSPRPPGARIEILLAQNVSGTRAVYAAVEWMALATPSEGRRPEPFRDPEPAEELTADAGRLLPVTPHGVRALLPPPPSDGCLVGTMQLVSSSRPSGFAATDPVAKAKLGRLRAWRQSFVEGMTTTVFPETGLTLTYPREGEIRRAVERMATRRVSHRPNLCAYTMREALGWGLGDAAMWADRLPDRGYKLREDGVARPGDIVVWPFTYGPTLGQHIGVAVAQGGTMMLLSNESGVLGTSRLKPGYLAFYRPRTTPDGEQAKTAVSPAISG